MKMASSKVIINGHLSKIINLDSGIRQGCPFSKDIFNLAINPLISFLENCNSIRKYTTMPNYKFLSISYVDDLNLFLNALSSLLNALHYINRFKDISGLQLNLEKTKGIFFNRKQLLSVTDLPRISWVKDLKILGIHYGSDMWRQSLWDDKFLQFKRDIGYYKSRLSTLDSKSMVSKFKLFSIFSYISGVYPMPTDYIKKIEKDLMSFVVPHKRTFLTLSDVASPRSLGGYDIDNIPLHAKFIFIRPIMTYVQQKLTGGALTKEMSFVEYFLGHQLCNMYKLPMTNRALHSFQPNCLYKNMLSILSTFKITCEELLEGSVINIYRRVISEGGPHSGPGINYGLLHRKIFPSYMKTFNFRLHFDLLPVKAKFQNFTPLNNSGCSFCFIHPETSVHLFAKCSTLTPLWDFLDDALNASFGTQCKYSFRMGRQRKYDYSLINLKCKPEFERLLLYLNAVVNMNIWKWRNKIKHDNVPFDCSLIKKSVIRSIVSRKNIEKSDRLRHCHHIELIENYCTSICAIRDAMFDPG